MLFIVGYHSGGYSGAVGTVWRRSVDDRIQTLGKGI